MGLEAGQAQRELGGNWGRSKAPALPLPPPRALRAHPGESPGLGGLRLQFAASCRGFQLHREPQGPPKDHSTRMCPSTTAKRRRRRSTSQLPWQPGCRRAPCTLSARAGGLGSPQTDPQPHCSQVRLPAGKGGAQPCRKPRKLPFAREAAGQYDSKSYFTVAKERHVSREKSAGQRRGIPAPGASRAARSPQNPPSLRGDPGPAPALTPFLTEGSSSHRHWVGARAPSRPLCRIQSWIPLPMPPKPHLEQSKRRYCWFSLPSPHRASSPWILVLQPSGRRDAPAVPHGPG